MWSSTGHKCTEDDNTAVYPYYLSCHLFQASRRSLRPTSLAPRSLSPMESLMEEILTPPALRRVGRNSPSKF